MDKYQIFIIIISQFNKYSIGKIQSRVDSLRYIPCYTQDIAKKINNREFLQMGKEKLDTKISPTSQKNPQKNIKTFKKSL